MYQNSIDIGDRLPAIHISRGRVPKSTWPEREPIIRRYAGRIPADELASMLGVTRGCLSSICSKRRISLKVPGRMSVAITRMHQRRKRQDISINIDRLWKPTSAGAQQ